MVSDPEFIARLVQYFEPFATVPDREKRRYIHGMVELAPGVVVVHDADRAYDIYFDTAHWEFVSPAQWEGTQDQGLDPLALRILPGKGRWPKPLKDFRETLAFARHHLRAKGERVWNRPHVTVPIPKTIRYAEHALRVS